MPEDRAPCRDFERGVCTRGRGCKYFHPENAAPAEGTKLPICKDFQNHGCDRMKCKFLHITQEEEVHYQTTGILPEHGGKAENVLNPPGMGNNICKDFLNGRCDRGSRCRYAHISEGEVHGKRSRVAGYHDGGGDGLAEENELLKCKVTDLQKEILNLRQMNDALYDQNTRYHSQLQTGNTGNYETVYPQYSQYPTYPSSSSVPTSSSALNAYSARPF